MAKKRKTKAKPHKRTADELTEAEVVQLCHELFYVPKRRIRLKNPICVAWSKDIQEAYAQEH